jgi:hypothetical protein
VAKRAGRQQYTILIEQAPGHGITGINILGNRMIHEANGGNDLDLATPDIGFLHDPAHTTEVVGVRMRVNDCNNRSFAKLLVNKVQRCLGSLLGRERIEDDPTGFALDETDTSYRP